MQVQLLTGPLLRHTGETHAVIWVETSAPCRVEVLDHTSPTFELFGHHYAVIVARDLQPGSRTPYEVRLDDDLVWPLPGDPPSHIRTPLPDAAITVATGSCRRIAPHTAPWTDDVDSDPHVALGPDALVWLARRCIVDEAQLPDLLALCGDQNYADAVSPATLEYITSRRVVDGDHDGETLNFDEHAFACREAFTEPRVRWLLANVPSLMLFDDHDVRDGWNSSQAWVDDMRQRAGWQDRVVAALSSYWVYQHVGNMSPELLDSDETFERVRNGDSDALVALTQRTIARSSEDPVRWSFRWDFGQVRIIAIDSRSARVLDEGRRDVLPPAEWHWVEQNTADVSGHVLLITSVPALMPHMIHHLETATDSLAAGARGAPGRKLAAWLRDAYGLEQWPAFPAGFDHLMRLVNNATRSDAVRSVVLAAGEVHYSYLTEMESTGAPALQVVSSPLRHPSPLRLRRMHKISLTRAGALAARIVAAVAKAHSTRQRWRITHGPWFGNVISLVRFERHAVRVDVHTSQGAREFRQVCCYEISTSTARAVSAQTSERVHGRESQ